MSHSETLRAKIELAGGPAPPSLARFWASKRLDELFPEFLILLHQIVRATVPLMATALERAKSLSSDGTDPCYVQLARYLDTHVEEERNHDKWVLEDLERSGWSRSSVLSRTPPSAIANLVGAQYYWVLHHDPTAILGYIAVLEGAPPSLSKIATVERATGLPTTLFRTYRKHAELDPGHRADFDRFIDDLPMDESRVSLLGLSAINTVLAFEEAVSGLLESAGRKP